MRSPKLVDGWHRILLRAWSVRLSIIAVVLEIVDALLPQLSGVLPDRLLTNLSIAATVGIPIARIIQQAKVSEK